MLFVYLIRGYPHDKFPVDVTGETLILSVYDTGISNLSNPNDPFAGYP